MTIGPPPDCYYCKHFHRGEGLKCDAFPEKIPDDIVMGEKHTSPFDDDHGILFDPLSFEDIEKIYGKETVEFLKKYGEWKKK